MPVVSSADQRLGCSMQRTARCMAAYYVGSGSTS